MAFAAVAQTVGNLIKMGFDTEYAPKRRGKLVASSILLLVNGLYKQTQVWSQAVEKGQTAKAEKIWRTRKLYAPAIMAFGLPVLIQAETDDSMAIEAYAKTVDSSGRKQGNIHDTTWLADSLFGEVAYFAATPEVMANAPGNEGWKTAKISCSSTIETLLVNDEDMKLLWPGDVDAEAGRIPFRYRSALLRFYTESFEVGLLGAGTQLPWWVMGYSDKDPKPLVPITLEVYTSLMQAVQTQQITNATLDAMGA